MANGHEVAMAIRAAYLSMHRQADAIFSVHGVTANQYVLLALLDEQDKVPQRDLVERAFSDPNTIRPMLVALERNGYVVREPHPDDGRAWCVSLTGRGRRRFKRLREESQPFRDRLMSVMTPNDAEVFVRVLRQVQEEMILETDEVSTR